MKYTSVTKEYTSKYSFLTIESLEYYPKYTWKYTHHGLFYFVKEIFLNVDANAMYNIHRMISLETSNHLVEVEGIIVVVSYPQCLEHYAFFMFKALSHWIENMFLNQQKFLDKTNVVYKEIFRYFTENMGDYNKDLKGSYHN